MALDTKYFYGFMCDWRELEKNLAVYNKTMGEYIVECLYNRSQKVLEILDLMYSHG